LAAAGIGGAAFFGFADAYRVYIPSSIHTDVKRFFVSAVPLFAACIVNAVFFADAKNSFGILEKKYSL
jgi:hypothetical protein